MSACVIYNKIYSRPPLHLIRTRLFTFIVRPLQFKRAFLSRFTYSPNTSVSLIKYCSKYTGFNKINLSQLTRVKLSYRFECYKMQFVLLQHRVIQKVAMLVVNTWLGCEKQFKNVNEDVQCAAMCNLSYPTI